MSCECLGTTAGKRHDLAKVLEGSEFSWICSPHNDIAFYRDIVIAILQI